MQDCRRDMPVPGKVPVGGPTVGRRVLKRLLGKAQTKPARRAWHCLTGHAHPRGEACIEDATVLGRIRSRCATAVTSKASGSMQRHPAHHVARVHLMSAKEGHLGVHVVSDRDAIVGVGVE